MPATTILERARHVTKDLAGRDVQVIALTWVDNAGITRAKAVPIERLLDAVTHGVGMSPVFDVFVVDDSMTSSPHIGGPVGDLRLYPDLEQVTVLSAQPGWAWAPVDRWTQDGEPYGACQRAFASSMAAKAADQGLTLQMAFEVEWFIARGGLEEVLPACTGPAYGMTRVIELSSYIRDVLRALSDQGVPVDQVHPEYAPGQLELSVAPADPVGAADRLVLVKQTIRAVSEAYGFRTSFAPVVVAGQVGNGCHLHVSAWSENRNLFWGGGGPYGLTQTGESMVAELLEHLPALCALGAPSTASYLRLVPQHWAGPYQCWGRENREAALRFITGTTERQGSAANVELKFCDASANPYLLTGAVTALVTAAADKRLVLPDEITCDPAVLPPDAQPPRLPETLSESTDRLARDDLLMDAMGPPLREAFLAVRRADSQLFAGKSVEEIVAATRWRY